MATTYPTSLASNHLDTVAEAGAITPSHGGMVQGHEFDLPISPKNANSSARDHLEKTPIRGIPLSATNGTSALPSTPLPTPSAPGVSTRRTTSVTRPRPVSMPPQAHAPPGTERDRQHTDDSARQRERGDGTASSRARTSNRILGDYTLSKTLGAGSMGKVKLAHHNITGEKVCLIHVWLVCTANSPSATSLSRRTACCQDPPTRHPSNRQRRRSVRES